MIQRIQSLLLAGVVILLTINLFVPIWSSDKGDKNFDFISVTAFSIDCGFANTPKQASIPVYYLGSLISLCIGLSLFIIFQYKKRSLQIILCSFLTLLLLGILGSYFIVIPKAKELMFTPENGDYGIGYFLPILSILLVAAARYFIRKDDELVKSVDRIR